MKIAAVTALSALALLSACAGTPPEPQPYLQIVLSNSSGVSYEYNSVVSLREIGDKATVHCSSEAKKPMLQGIISQPSGNQVASFTCQ